MAVAQTRKASAARTAIEQMVLDSLNGAGLKLAGHVKRKTTSQVNSPTFHSLYSIIRYKSRLSGLSRASSSLSARFNREATVPGEHSSTEAISS